MESEPMTNEPMTAEQRLRELFSYDESAELEDLDKPLVTLIEAHTEAAVTAAERRWMYDRVRCECSAADACRFARERDKARQEVLRLQQCRSELDCSFAGAFGESDGASHCPADKPCQRCTLERERDDVRARCREAAQTLLAAIGAEGPENVEDAARRAAQRVADLERERDEAREHVFDFWMEEARRRPKKATEARIATIQAFLEEMPPTSDDVKGGE